MNGRLTWGRASGKKNLRKKRKREREMANTPSSIDNFLEHIKRSASKAMDTDWITTETLTNYQTSTSTTAASFNHLSPMKTTRTRSSCFDISQLGSSTGKQSDPNPIY